MDHIRILVWAPSAILNCSNPCLGSQQGWHWLTLVTGVAGLFDHHIEHSHWIHSRVAASTYADAQVTKLPHFHLHPFNLHPNVWAFINTLYYLAKGKVQQVIKPERRWGPGDKEVRQQILEEMTHGQIPRVGAYAYENNGMAYEAYHM